MDSALIKEYLEFHSIVQLLAALQKATIKPPNIATGRSLWYGNAPRGHPLPEDERFNDILTHLINLAVRRYETIAALPSGTNIIINVDGAQKSKGAPVEGDIGETRDDDRARVSVSTSYGQPIKDIKCAFDFLHRPEIWEQHPPSRIGEHASSNWEVSFTAHFNLILFYTRQYYGTSNSKERSFFQKRLTEYVFLVSCPRINARVHHGQRLGSKGLRSIFSYLVDPSAVKVEQSIYRPLGVDQVTLEMEGIQATVSDIDAGVLARTLPSILKRIAKNAEGATKGRQNLGKAVFNKFNFHQSFDDSEFVAYRTAAIQLCSAVSDLRDLTLTRKSDLVSYLSAIDEAEGLSSHEIVDFGAEDEEGGNHFENMQDAQERDSIIEASLGESPPLKSWVRAALRYLEFIITHMESIEGLLHQSKSASKGMSRYLKAFQVKYVDYESNLKAKNLGDMTTLRKTVISRAMADGIPEFSDKLDRFLEANPLVQRAFKSAPHSSLPGTIHPEALLLSLFLLRQSARADRQYRKRLFRSSQLIRGFRNPSPILAVTNHCCRSCATLVELARQQFGRTGERLIHPRGQLRWIPMHIPLLLPRACFEQMLVQAKEELGRWIRFIGTP